MNQRFLFVALSGLVAWGCFLSPVFGLDLGDKREEFLAAETLEATGLRQENLESVFYRLMENVIRDDPELAADLVLHTDRLILQEERREGGGWFEPTWNGRTHLGRYLRSYEKRTESIDAIGVLVRTYRKDTGNRIPHTWWDRAPVRFALLGRFLRWGGNYDTAGAMEDLGTELRAVCGEGEMVFLAPFFANFSELLRPSQRVELARWAAHLAGEPDLTLSGMGEAILLGLGIFERTENNPVGETAIPRGPALDARLMEILRDESLSLAWRAGVTSLLGMNFRDRLSPDLRLETGRILTRVLAEEVPFSNISFSYAVSVFLRGDDADEGWREIGREMLLAWERRNEHNHLSNKTGRALRPSKEWLIPVMELACRVGTGEQVGTHLAKFRGESNVGPGFWINLVRSGKYELAREVHQACRGLAFRSDHFRLDTVYDSRLAEATPGYLKTITSERDRVFAELMLSAVVDPGTPLSHPHPSTQQSRFQAFAEQHAALPAWKGEQLMRALEVFSLGQRNDSFTGWLVDHQIGLEKRIEQEEPEMSAYWAARMEIHHAIEQLEEGAIFPTQFVWGRVIEEDNQVLERHRSYLAEAIIDMIDGRLRVACQERDGSRLEHFLTICRQMLETVPDSVYRPDVRRFSIRVVASHALCDRMEDWNDWWKQLSPLRKRHLIALLQDSESNLVHSLGELFNRNDGAPGEVFASDTTRRRIFREILSTDWVDQSAAGFSLLAAAGARRMLTETDLLDVAGPIARSAPREGSSWREYLGVLSDRRDLMEALRVLDDELAVVKPELPLAGVLRVEKWLILTTLNRGDEARRLEAELAAGEWKLPREYGAIGDYLEKR